MRSAVPRGLETGEQLERSRTVIDDENAPVGVPLGKFLEEAAIQEFAARFSGELIRRGDEGYDDARIVYNAMIDRHPALSPAAQAWPTSSLQ
ncbi:MAG: hypothetical protein M3118_05890 [Actinomycetota bacterium]|nr:hypothetical protein [Actinomycetota bacterium]